MEFIAKLASDIEFGYQTLIVAGLKTTDCIQVIRDFLISKIHTWTDISTLCIFLELIVFQVPGLMTI